MKKHKIALVVPVLAGGGGVPSVAMFLYRTLTASETYQPELISLAMSWRDQNSVRLTKPTSWHRGVQISHRMWQGIPYRHVGTVFSELEFQRYQPHASLTELLNQYDLIQVVAGTPVWALVTLNLTSPVCLFTATLTQEERVSLRRQTTGWKKYWLSVMTHLATRFERLALSHVDYIFGESHYTLDILSKQVEHEKLGLGVPGVDATLFQHVAHYDTNGYILSVGRFSDPRKNVCLLFTAYAQLRRTNAQVPKLVLVGNTMPSPQDWEYALSLGLQPDVEMHEDVSPEQLAQFYQQAALFVLSSDEEGLGLVILEAMACGLPVISTDCGGPSTAIVAGETGLLTPVGDAPALAEAMRSLLEKPTLRQQMGQAGRQRVEEKFSLEVAGKIYLDTYDKLLNRGR